VRRRTKEILCAYVHTHTHTHARTHAYGMSEGGEVAHKIIVLGECGVGKSSIIRRISTGKFDKDFDFDDFKDSTTIKIKVDDHIIRFVLWDTAGQEQFQSLPRSYFRDASACLLVFDLANKASFSGAKAWKEELDRRRLDGDVISVLAGNKSDLKQEVDDEEIESFSEKYELKSIRCSAKTGENLQSLFISIARELKARARPLSTGTSGKVVVHRKKDAKKKKGC